MEKTPNQAISIENLTFTYPKQIKPTLESISLTINEGEFVVFCGLSGCGKTTLLRQLKPSLRPHGQSSGSILFEGCELSQVSKRDTAAKIGFVLQNPENQTVTDKVWHELAFGMESLGFDNPTIRLRVAEMASFFGIQTWFHKDVHELSGGQKQLLALASVMALQPSVLILDEPTSQLDPIAAADFLATLGKINRELGVTIILTEHRLEETFPLASRMVALDNGRIIADGKPTLVGETLRKLKHGMFTAMPVPMRVWASVKSEVTCPTTVRDGRRWLSSIKEQITPLPIRVKEVKDTDKSPAIEMKEVWFKYGKELPDIVKGLSFEAYHGEVTAILGGNGTGKTTTLSLLAGLNTPYRGLVKIDSSNISNIAPAQLFDKWLGYLPQNPQSLFSENSVRDDLLEMISRHQLSTAQQQEQLREITDLCDLNKLLDSHPYDLSGGEQQRAALAKVLLLQPQILLLDEPTKGLDAEFKVSFAALLKKLTSRGVAIIIVSHDIEFCAEYADECVLFFDGSIVTKNPPREFFSGNNFYTSSANRMARHLLPEAITAKDIVTSLGGTYVIDEKSNDPNNEYLLLTQDNANNNNHIIKVAKAREDSSQWQFSKQTLIGMIVLLILVPLTIYLGTHFLGERRYLIISILVILEMMMPFILSFEKRKPKARELVIIAVLCAIGVASRAAFFMLPQFKPIVAIVIIVGVSFGGDTGFLFGALSALIGNMFFGQGPWTPWQMFALGVIGFMAGIIFNNGLIKRTKLLLCVFGGLATLVIYGGIINSSTIFMYQNTLTWQMFTVTYVRGLPFDIIHSVATIVFLMVLGKPILGKLERVKIKYGLMEMDV
jgi:ATPase components of various ABC-type transport systems, contain duplicated ATPase